MTRGEIWWIDFGLAFPGMPLGCKLIGHPLLP